MQRNKYILYQDSVEVKQQDEDALVDRILASIARTSQETFDLHRHAIRQEHAKSHGILKGELTVYKDLPEHLRQGLFAVPGSYPIIVRFSTAPGDIHSDRVPSRYGMAIKALGVSGPKADAADATRNQDILLVNSPIYFADTAEYWKVQQIIERQTGGPQEILAAVELFARGVGGEFQRMQIGEGALPARKWRAPIGAVGNFSLVGHVRLSLRLTSAPLK